MKVVFVSSFPYSFLPPGEDVRQVLETKRFLSMHPEMRRGRASLSRGITLGERRLNKLYMRTNVS